MLILACFKMSIYLCTFPKFSPCILDLEIDVMFTIRADLNCNVSTPYTS